MQGDPGAVSKGSCSKSAQPGHLLCRKWRGVCWKSAFNLGFLFSALGDAQTGLSFKLFHTSFSKLSSQSKEAGGREKVESGEERPFPSQETLGAEHSSLIKVLKLWTSGHQGPIKLCMELAQLGHNIKMYPKVLTFLPHVQGSPASALFSFPSCQGWVAQPGRASA